MTSEDSTLQPGDAQLLAKRLREAREFVNLSQQFVAEQTGIPRSAISEIERGGRRVESLELKRLAQLYRMPVDYLLGNEPEAEGAVEGLDPTIAALARTAEGMGEGARQEVLRFAMFLQNYEPKDQES
jgi:transcriptional regulator with XRE-family HTH domain